MMCNINALIYFKYHNTHCAQSLQCTILKITVVMFVLETSKEVVCSNQFCNTEHTKDLNGVWDTKGYLPL